METIGLSNSITIASIVITLVSIAVSVAFALRRRKYPGSIMFIREEAVALLDDFATRLPNLTVLYKDAPVGKNLVLLRGYLLNNGSIDITPEMAEQPLTVTLPNGCAWLEFTLTGTTENLHAEGKIVSPSILQIVFSGLFRRDEAFSFQALVTVDAEEYGQQASSLAEALHWTHRIANLETVKMMTISSSPADEVLGMLNNKQSFLKFFGIMVVAPTIFTFGVIKALPLLILTEPSDKLVSFFIPFVFVFYFLGYTVTAHGVFEV